MALRRRASTALATTGEQAPSTVILGPGHLGVTLTNHALGVRVESAEPADSVFRAGIRAGDVIVAVNCERVFEHESACELLGSNVDRPIVLHDGPQPGIAVEFYTAAAATAIVASRGVAGRVLGAIGGAITGRAASRDEIGFDAGGCDTIQGQLLLGAAVVLLVVIWWRVFGL